MAIFGNNEFGMQCEELEDGSKSCKRYKLKGKDALATGTDFDLIIDPNTCKVRINGRINDEDRPAIAEHIKEMESRCKKGF